MKGKAVICIVVLILALISMGIGCDSTKGGGVVDMMKKVPIGSNSFMFVNADAMQTDADLEKVHNDLEDSFGEITEYLGFDFDEVDRLAISGPTSNILLEGDFILDKVREKMEELNHVRDEYHGIEIWELEGLSIAIVSNKLIVLGAEDNIKDCIKVIKGEAASLYDDKDFRDVMERLPSGIAVQCTERAFPLNSERYDGLEVAGVSMMKKDEHSIVITGICKFENKEYASDAIDEIENDIENGKLEEWRNIDITQNAEFIMVTVEQDIEEAFD